MKNKIQSNEREVLTKHDVVCYNENNDEDSHFSVKIF